MSKDMTVTVRYFAALREQRGVNDEALTTSARTAAELYEALRTQHGFSLAPSQLRAVINDEFCDWNQAISPGDTIVFIPPVAGG